MKRLEKLIVWLVIFLTGMVSGGLLMLCSVEPRLAYVIIAIAVAILSYLYFILCFGKKK